MNFISSHNTNQAWVYDCFPVKVFEALVCCEAEHGAVEVAVHCVTNHAFKRGCVMWLLGNTISYYNCVPQTF